MKLLLKLAVLTAVCAWLPVANGHESSKTMMYASDVLGVPGEPLTLSVKVLGDPEVGNKQRPVTGETVEFLLYSVEGRELGDPLPIGTAETDGEGRATLVLNPIPWPGLPEIIEVGARLVQGQITASETRMEIVVPPVDRPLLLVKIDANQSGSPDAPATAAKPQGVSGATVLTVLAEQQQLVYLTEVEGRAVLWFKSWMQRRGLPHGPLLLLADQAASLDQNERLTMRVRELVQANPRISIGIGATAADAQAFVTNGLAAIIVPVDMESVGELPDGAFATSNWTNAYTYLRLCEMSGELLRNFEQGGEQAREALNQLDQLGRSGVACVDRLREVAELRPAAIYVGGRLRGSNDFWDTVDLSTSEAARDALLAAWRFGEPSVIGRLYATPQEGAEYPLPAYVRWELLGEPKELGAAGVVYTIRLTGEDESSDTYAITCVRQPDSTWRIRAVDPVASKR